MEIYTDDFEMPAEDHKEIFVITDDHMADWALRKIAKREQEFERLKAIAEEQIDRIQMQIDAEEKKCERDTSFLIGKLSEFFETVEASETKTQRKYKLLSGTLVMQKAKSKPIYDRGELLSFVKADESLHDFIKVEESVRWADLKKTLTFDGDKAIITDTGEVIDCIKFEQVDETFSVETK